ncbi:S49 family peptidase [Saccharothrix australiensis]|uniref:S49 family peptidase n=1 Tax=Saccharothrix australiensis TaxID=2072 RepID=UPI001FE7C662|nr:S49 family peptidase [Saccharothrix australiensis]
MVAAVRLHGVITPTPTPMARNTINVQNTESALTRAFDHDRLVAVALLINSPGGAPTQSALIAERIRELAAKRKVPVLAFCEDVAASGGYWLACAADEIYAHGTSLVGSIGVVSAGFGLNGLLERHGIERRVYTAGEHKVRLDPFRPEKPEDVEWLKGLHADLHAQFVAWVKERRGPKLRVAAWSGDPAPGSVDAPGPARGSAGAPGSAGSAFGSAGPGPADADPKPADGPAAGLNPADKPADADLNPADAAPNPAGEPANANPDANGAGGVGGDLFSGEVWTGAKAVELGLVDALGTLRSVVAKRYPDAEISIAEPRRPLLARLGLAGSTTRSGDFLPAALAALEERARWSRFGL